MTHSHKSTCHKEPCQRFALRVPRRDCDRPGLHGLIATGDPLLLRLLVTDDRAYDVVSAQLLNGHAGMIDVFAVAQRCAELLESLPRWRAETVTAMTNAGLSIYMPLGFEIVTRMTRFHRTG
jgi:hypothetical protein